MLEEYTEQEKVSLEISLKEEDDRFTDYIYGFECPDEDEIKDLERNRDNLEFLGLTSSKTYSSTIQQIEDLKRKNKHYLENIYPSTSLIDDISSRFNILVISKEYFQEYFKKEQKLLKEYDGEIDEEILDELVEIKTFLDSSSSVDYIRILNSDIGGGDCTDLYCTEFEGNLVIYQYFPMGIIIYDLN